MNRLIRLVWILAFGFGATVSSFAGTFLVNWGASYCGPAMFEVDVESPCSIGVQISAVRGMDHYAPSAMGPQIWYADGAFLTYWDTPLVNRSGDSRAWVVVVITSETGNYFREEMRSTNDPSQNISLEWGTPSAGRYLIEIDGTAAGSSVATALVGIDW